MIGTWVAKSVPRPNKITHLTTERANIKYMQNVYIIKWKIAMPPPAVKTIKDLIFYQYANIIAKSSGISGYRFIMDRMKKLSSVK